MADMMHYNHIEYDEEDTLTLLRHMLMTDYIFDPLWGRGRY